MRTKKFVYHLLAMFVIAATLLSACGTKTEGELTVIALPHDWCNYGEVIAGFSAKYGIKVNELGAFHLSYKEVRQPKATGYACNDRL